MSEHETWREYLGDGCIAIHSSFGGITFRWYQSDSLRWIRDTVWDGLRLNVRVCPHCSHQWTPRKPEPQSCPRCKQYLVGKKREPWPEGFERVDPDEWDRARRIPLPESCDEDEHTNKKNSQK